VLDARCRDSSRAIALARSATRRPPQDPEGWTTLGLARRRGEVEDALKRVKGLQQGGNITQILILAHVARSRRGAARPRSTASTTAPTSQDASPLVSLAPAIDQGLTAPIVELIGSTKISAGRRRRDRTYGLSGAGRSRTSPPPRHPSPAACARSGRRCERRRSSTHEGLLAARGNDANDWGESSPRPRLGSGGNPGSHAIDRVGGRKTRMTPGKLESARERLRGETAPRGAARSLGVSVPTLDRWVPATGLRLSLVVST
jgi:hypothetical protein